MFETKNSQNAEKKDHYSREQIKEAIAYFCILMIYIDGVVDKNEVRAAIATLGRCGLFSDNSNDDDFELLQRMEKAVISDSSNDAERYGPMLAESSWKYTAAAIIADIMVSDGEMDTREIELISRFARITNIDKTQLDCIIATITALRRDW